MEERNGGGGAGRGGPHLEEAETYYCDEGGGGVQAHPLVRRCDAIPICLSCCLCLCFGVACAKAWNFLGVFA